jgi:hypothetical protein
VTSAVRPRTMAITSELAAGSQGVLAMITRRILPLTPRYADPHARGPGIIRPAHRLPGRRLVQVYNTMKPMASYKGACQC